MSIARPLRLFLSLCFALTSVLATAQTLQNGVRIEPPNWWTGMNHDSVEVLLYYPNIQKYQVRSTLPVDGVVTPPNPNYYFVTVNTLEQRVGDYTITLFNDDGDEDIILSFPLMRRDAGSANREGFDSRDVVYLIMPDRFANGDPDNDSTPDTKEKAKRNKKGGRHGGDLQGVINNLDYLENLGVTALWSTPLLEDNEPVYSYHGYAQTDLYRIDPRYGTNRLYRQLSDEMKSRGMKLIMDYVTNHWGISNYSVQDPPFEDWFHKWEDGTDTGFKRSIYKMTTNFDYKAAERDQKATLEGWFDTTMPDMNQDNPHLLNYLVQNAIWWIEYASLDGLRVDTYSYNDKDALAQWTEAIMDEYPNFNIVAEVWFHNQAQIAYWQRDSQIGAIQGYNSHVPSVMDFTLTDATNIAFNERPEHTWQPIGMNRIYENMAMDFLYPNPSNLLTFLGNHDTTRFNQRYDQDIEAYTLGLALILTQRGIPQLYYGDEIGMMGDQANGDGDIRRDFPGGWKGDKNNAFKAGKRGRDKTQQQFYDVTQRLLQFRKDSPAIHEGRTVHHYPENDVYVYTRRHNDQWVLTILNNSDKPRTLRLKDYLQDDISRFRSGREVITNKTMILDNGTLDVAPRQAMVIDLHMN